MRIVQFEYCDVFLSLPYILGIYDYDNIIYTWDVIDTLYIIIPFFCKEDLLTYKNLQKYATKYVHM